MAEIIIKPKIDTAEVDAAQKKVERLMELLREAKSLSDDLASGVSEINLNVHF